MAELVDAPASGAGVCMDVEVRVLFWAPITFLECLIVQRFTNAKGPRIARAFVVFISCRALCGAFELGASFGACDVGHDVLAICFYCAQIRNHAAPTEHDDTVHKVHNLPHVVANKDQRVAVGL